MVLPFMAVTTSPGFVALCPGMFSHSAIKPDTQITHSAPTGWDTR